MPCPKGHYHARLDLRPTNDPTRPMALQDGAGTFALDSAVDEAAERAGDRPV